MTGRGTAIFIALIALICICAALAAAQSVFVPLVFALFVMAVAWPLQRRLERVLPQGAAVLVTVVATLLTVAVVSYLVVWGFGRVGQWTLANAARFQALYAEFGDFLEQHGLVLASLISDHFDARWLVRLFTDLSGRLQGLFSFLIITSVYVLLGLLETLALKAQLAALKRPAIGTYLMAAGADAAARLQTYMLVRTIMSLATGAAVWAFTLAAGLELAIAWGVIAFALNYIPFLGPFIATLLPTLFALVQFGSWQTALVVFVVLNLIQFVSGSYLEPRIAGKAVAVSPFMMLFAVFFFAFLWGLPGAFIGVPVLITLLTFCAHHPDSRWIADLLSGNAPEEEVSAAAPERL